MNEAIRKVMKGIEATEERARKQVAALHAQADDAESVVDELYHLRMQLYRALHPGWGEDRSATSLLLDESIARIPTEMPQDFSVSGRFPDGSGFSPGVKQ